jgi:hypothetical protein
MCVSVKLPYSFFEANIPWITLVSDESIYLFIYLKLRKKNEPYGSENFVGNSSNTEKPTAKCINDH